MYEEAQQVNPTPGRDERQSPKPENLGKLINADASLYNMANPALLSSVYANLEHARKLRQAAREHRAEAKATMARARLLRSRVHKLDIEVQHAKTEVTRKTTLRDESVNALKQSLRDLEDMRMAPSGDKGLDKLKADIRKTLERSR